MPVGLRGLLSSETALVRLGAARSPPAATAKFGGFFRLSLHARRPAATRSLLARRGSVRSLRRVAASPELVIAAVQRSRLSFG
jgi:hypothetical protein